MSVSITTSLAWRDQALTEQLAWLKAKNNGINFSSEQLVAFEAGFRAGWLKCHTTLELHATNTRASAL